MGLVDIGEKFIIEAPISVDKNGNIVVGKVSFEVIGILDRDTDRSLTTGKFNTHAVFENTVSIMQGQVDDYFFGYGYVIGGYGFFLELRDMKDKDKAIRKTSREKKRIWNS